LYRARKPGRKFSQKKNASPNRNTSSLAFKAVCKAVVPERAAPTMNTMRDWLAGSISRANDAIMAGRRAARSSKAIPRISRLAT
jgi:hypothetical protein